MANAPGMARIIGNILGSQTFVFQPYRSNGIPINSVSVVGAFPQVPADSNVCVFNGSDPEIVNNGTSLVTIRTVTIFYETSSIANRMCTIVHGYVDLNPGDTIVYTDIEMIFTTDNLPA